MCQVKIVFNILISYCLLFNFTSGTNKPSRNITTIISIPTREREPSIRITPITFNEKLQTWTDTRERKKILKIRSLINVDDLINNFKNLVPIINNLTTISTTSSSTVVIQYCC